MITSLISLYKTVANVEELLKNITIANVVKFVKSAWNAVKSSTIRNCFKKCLFYTEQENDKEFNTSIENDVVALVKNINFDYDFNNLDLIDEKTYSDDEWENKFLDSYINCDDSLINDNEEFLTLP
ncbi:hypothetical protein DMUE_1443 [Dictyocoela muelleri]|nr:hypothetical protein DMUE_1443 [Dictyocoela muelleri]